ncbi:MAG: PQQ-dependent sugar dehydrogenase [Rhodothermaceae bacterium]|nr:PQQ-dependent sugar dehydrogenase [Rhodothermaceae bacterium]MYC05293.1 PQQ-dependent sugar dehydrogenase [Rhodothermaceae bacterium]MYI18443.1 PQQ-dependent sugar dehydrogenase [Rhodothermaceae bacterium]
MMIRTPLLFIVMGFILSSALPVYGQASVLRSAYHDYRVVDVAQGFERPWSIAFLPGGDMLVTELSGRLRIVREGKLLEEPVAGVPEVLAQGQGGLLDVVPHPDFASNRLIYLSFSKPLADSEGATTAVVRGRFENDRLIEVEQIFEADSRGRGHYGCRLAFDGNGYLFITVGDRQIPPRGDLEAHPAQDLSNHHGTVIRVHDDGRVPTDNPFVDQAGIHPEIWSYGHRNAQGLAIHPETGDIWINEHGPLGGDELNLIHPGLNYGWPVVGYGVNYRSGTAIHEGIYREGMEPPVYFWVPSIATSGMLIYTGDRFPAWHGNFFVGGLSGQQLARLTLDGQEVEQEETLHSGRGRIRDVRQGPDGYIYLAIDDRQGGLTSVVKLEPADAH